VLAMNDHRHTSEPRRYHPVEEGLGIARVDDIHPQCAQEPGQPQRHSSSRSPAAGPWRRSPWRRVSEPRTRRPAARQQTEERNAAGFQPFTHVDNPILQPPGLRLQQYVTDMQGRVMILRHRRHQAADPGACDADIGRVEYANEVNPQTGRQLRTLTAPVTSPTSLSRSPRTCDRGMTASTAGQGGPPDGRQPAAAAPAWPQQPHRHDEEQQ